jgi:hypothetical protein
MFAGVLPPASVASMEYTPVPLTRLIYYSRSALPDGAKPRLEGLKNIVAIANEKNRARNVTGALAFDDAHFIQVLEGERRDVWETFQRIANDSRHTDVTLVQFTDVPERLFGNWWMGLGRRTPETESLFNRLYGTNGQMNVDELTSIEMLHVLIKLAQIGFDRELTSSGKTVLAKAS